MIKEKLIPILGVALLGALAFGAIQTARIGKYKLATETAQNEVTKLLAADTGKERTIRALVKSAEAIRTEANAQEAAAKAAGDRLEATQAELHRTSKALAAAEANEYAEPTCQGVLETDLARACPAHADGVRQRAARGLSGPNR